MKFGRLAGLFIQFCTVLLPWPLRRRVLQRWFGYQISPSARIALAWVYPRRLEMGPDSRIGAFTVAIHLDRIKIGDHSTIGRRNWITGFRSGTDSMHFAHQPDRVSELIMGRHSAITKNHHLDCTSPIRIGDFVTIAGYYSQFLTHSIDLEHSRQSSDPITISDYCFIGTNVVVLGGASLPAYSVLGACSLLNNTFDNPYHLYAGVPARPIREIIEEQGYFTRTRGFVH